MSRLLTPQEATNILTIEELNKFGTVELSILLSEIQRRTAKEQDIKTQRALGDKIEELANTRDRYGGLGFIVKIADLSYDLRKGMFLND